MGIHLRPYQWILGKQRPEILNRIHRGFRPSTEDGRCGDCHLE